MNGSDDIEIIPGWSGRFVSRGKGSHIVRRISTHELVFCVKGVLRMFEEERFFELHPGDYYLLKKGRLHGGTEKYPAGLSFFWLHFDCAESLFESVPQTGHCAREEQLSLYLQSYLTEQSLVSPSSEIQKLLLLLIFRELERATVPENQLPNLVLRAEEFVKIHFAEPVTIKDAAIALHCNSEYLGRIFHIHFKETFTARLNRIRIEHAAKLLMESNLSIKEIVTECGFNDPAYFRRIFYNRYASTPGNFRKFHSSGYCNTE